MQYVFALSMDIDGFPGGPLYRSDASGAPSSWTDMTTKLRDALAQVRLPLSARQRLVRQPQERVWCPTERRGACMLRVPAGQRHAADRHHGAALA